MLTKGDEMTTMPPASKTPSPFDYLRNFFALFALCAAGAALAASGPLADVVPNWIAWPVAITFVGIVVALGLVLSLQIADDLLSHARNLLAGPWTRHFAAPLAFTSFTLICALGVGILIAPFFPDVVGLVDV